MDIALTVFAASITPEAVIASMYLFMLAMLVLAACVFWLEPDEDDEEDDDDGL